MPDFPSGGFNTGQIVIGPGQVLPDLVQVASNIATTGAWPSANQAIFIPFQIATPYVATQMFVVNGGTVSGNIDVGIYDSQGNRLVSIGSTAQAGTSAIQTFDITDTTLNPGSYYLACAMDNTTGIINNYTGGSLVFVRSVGVLSMASAFALPNPATFAASSSIYIPGVYVTGSAVV